MIGNFHYENVMDTMLLIINTCQYTPAHLNQQLTKSTLQGGD